MERWHPIGSNAIAQIRGISLLIEHLWMEPGSLEIRIRRAERE
jgi:hypothetical protein